MSSKKIGEARQSQLVTTYGVGSLFPSVDQSFMIMGTEYWPTRSPQVDEPRLASALRVTHFRTPAAGLRNGDAPVVQFPLMHYCPRCHRLGDLTRLRDQQSMYCKRCPGTKLVPSRFVACCDTGHIEDFPYWQWVHSGEQSAAVEHELSLRIRGESSSLSDIVVGCSCGVAPKSLAGSFGKQALLTVKRCGGSRPWLETDDLDCERPLRTLQRGSSNVWFASMRSTISIPPWSTAAAAFLERHWAILGKLDDDTLDSQLDTMVAGQAGVTAAGVRALIAYRRGLSAHDPLTDAELRADEYKALCNGTGEAGAADTFVCEEEDVEDDLASLVAQVSSVGRLREVRALEGFSRVTPHLPNDNRPLAPLSVSSQGWLPAVEVHGEGIFVRLDEDLMASWENGASAQQRTALLNAAQDRLDRDFSRPASPPIAARAVALHTWAHMLLDQLSLQAGYPASALRERVYAGPGQAGILIYTASSDSAGSLGGLAALAHSDRFGEIFRAALAAGRWCSSDPVCAESQGSGTDNLNLAACHACVLLPETSCESRNLLLDRVSVVGSAEHPDAALFPA